MKQQGVRLVLMERKTAPENSGGTQHTVRLIDGKIEVDRLRFPTTARTIEHERLRMYLVG